MKHLRTFEKYDFKPTSIKDIRKDNTEVSDFCKGIEKENGTIEDITLTSNGERYLIYYKEEGSASATTKSIKKG